MKVLLTDAISRALRVSLVDKQRATVETCLVLPNHCFAWVADLELNFLVHLVSNVIVTLFDENYFVDII